MKKLLLILLLISTTASAEEFRQIEMTCSDSFAGRFKIHHFILGGIDPATKFIVKELRMAGSTPYVLLENPEDRYETRELIWSPGWHCLLERHIRK